MTRRRLDLELVRRQLVSSRTEAQAAIARGEVLVGGAPALNAARMVDAGEPLRLTGPPPRFVSRGGEKLDAALKHFAIDVTGKRALDVGASTGGFTDCLLQNGASFVVALDVGYGQIHERMRHHPRVEVRERTNIRHVDLGDFDDTPFEVITIDVSFISLRTIAPAVCRLARPGADIVALVKPQFEAGKAEVSKGKGVVRNPEIWREVITDVVGEMEAQRVQMMGVVISPLLGAEGNVEFLAWMRAQSRESGENSLVNLDLEQLIEQAKTLSDQAKTISDQTKDRQ